MIQAGTAAPPAQPRRLADRCPGLLRPHAAEDGLLVRLRLPGGQTDGATLVELSRISTEFGEGSVQLTSRGNVQLRGLAESRWPALVERVAATGLLPSVTHERVRNLVASPLTGLTGERPDLRPMVDNLDAALCRTAELAELPGRFLFAIDDGRGDVLSMRFDLAYLARDADAGWVLVGDRRQGVATAAKNAVGLMIALAQAFRRVRARSGATVWHMAELADVSVLHPAVTPIGPMTSAGPVPLGAVCGAASVGVPLSLLTPQQVSAVDAAAAGGAVVVTPWRGLVIPGAAHTLSRLRSAGLVTDDNSAWSQLTACIGAPGCAKSRISTAGLSAELTAALATAPTLPVHVSGCERRCGAPAGQHHDLVAPGGVEDALALIEGGR
ncbi:MAG TPA: precorrin-3B synthase [Propionibacteriaceae bacterium]|nr:precorrin-3B synthase [Propionibacteriaceae bacterium]